MRKPDEKNITIRFPIDLWKRLKLAQIEGQITSINQAALDGAQMLLDSLNEKQLPEHG